MISIRFYQKIFIISLSWIVSSYVTAVQNEEKYNDISISSKDAADKILESLSSKTKLFTNYEQTYDALDEYGNSSLSEANIVFLTDDHQGIDSRLLMLKTYLELRKKGDVILFEDLDQLKGLLGNQICGFLFKAFMFPAKGANLDSAFNYGERFKTYSTAIEKKAAKNKFDLSKIWTGFPCGGWDSEEMVKITNTILTDDSISLDQAFNFFGLKSEKKSLRSKLSSFTLSNAKLGLSDIARNQAMIAAIKKHSTKKNRVFVLGGLAHIPDLDAFFTDSDFPYKISLENLIRFLDNKKYVVLKDKKMTPEYIEQLRAIEAQGQEDFLKLKKEIIHNDEL